MTPTRAETPQTESPLPGLVLDFLAQDIANHPQRLQAIDAGLVQGLQALTKGTKLNLDAPLSADDE